MKKLLAFALALLTSSSAHAYANYRVLAGMDTYNSPAISFEIEQRAAVYGLQLYLPTVESEKFSGSVASQPYDFQTEYHRDDISLYGGYQLETGLILKGGLTLSAGSVKATERLSNTPLKSSYTTYRPFIGSSYPLTRHSNINIHYTFGGSEVLELDNENRIGRTVDLEDNLSIMFGFML